MKRKILISFIITILILSCLIGTLSCGEKPKPEKIDKIGEPVITEKWQVTVHNFWKAKQLGKREIPAEEQAISIFVVVDLTVKNITNNPLIFSTLVLAPVAEAKTGGGIKTYNCDYESEAALPHPFKENVQQPFVLRKIAPNQESSGEVAFHIPKESTNIKLIIPQGAFTSQKLVWELK